MKCDVLLTYEIKNREIENLCLIKRELQRRGYSVLIREQYGTFFSSNELPLEAKLVVVPAYYRPRAQFYSSSHTVRTDRILNMMWEQTFNGASEVKDTLHSIKPWGRQAVHIAWGDRTKRMLEQKWGVDSDHVFMTGHIALDFLRYPLIRYYDDKESLFSKYNIPLNKRVHLFISSLAIADMDDRVLKNAATDKNGEQRYYKYKQLCIETRRELVRWFDLILQENPNDIIIYRPHPEEKDCMLLRGLVQRQERFFVIREQSVKQWIITCDNIYTWMSTSIAEACAAGKRCQILRPIELPKELDIGYYHSASNIATYEQFQQTFTAEDARQSFSADALRQIYHIPPNKFSFELVCDVIELMMKDDKYRITPPMTNPLLKWYSIERFKNAIKRMVAQSSLMKKIHESSHFKTGVIREAIDDVFYVKDKLEKNKISEEEISHIIDKIDNALALPNQ